MFHTSHGRRIMIIGNGSCQHAAEVALSLSQAEDIVFKSDISPFRGLYNTILSHGLLSKSPSTWEQSEFAAFRNAAVSDKDLLEYHSAQAKQIHKPLVVMVNPAFIASPDISGWAGYEMPLSEADMSSPIGRIQLQAANTPSTDIWNKTIFADDYLCSWEMVFVFEHPLDSVTEAYRLIRTEVDQARIQPEEIEPLLDLSTTLDHTRTLLRFCLGKSAANLAPRPMIVHKSDLNHGPNGVIGKLCEALRLEKPPVPPRELQGRRRDSVEAAAAEVYMDIGRKNVKRYISGEISEWEARLKRKMLRWEKEFDEETAELLREQARTAMPSYYSFANYCLSV